jgi:hypothetical protein
MGVGQALAALPPGAWMRGVAWAYPLVESLHIVALGTLFGAMAVVDLRLLGFSRALPMAPLIRHAVPLALLAFCLAGVTGLLLFLAHADDLVGNRIFVLKICLIGAAGTNAAIFHTGNWGDPAHWGESAPLVPRLLAVSSLIIWVGVIFCGRWIAYA